MASVEYTFRKLSTTVRLRNQENCSYMIEYYRLDSLNWLINSTLIVLGAFPAISYGFLLQ